MHFFQLQLLIIFQERSPLVSAAQYGFIDNIRFLLGLPSIDPTLGNMGFGRIPEFKRNNSPIFVAIYNGKIEAAKYMIQNEIIRNEFEDTIKVCNSSYY